MQNKISYKTYKIESFFCKPIYKYNIGAMKAFWSWIIRTVLNSIVFWMPFESRFDSPQDLFLVSVNLLLIWFGFLITSLMDYCSNLYLLLQNLLKLCRISSAGFIGFGENTFDIWFAKVSASSISVLAQLLSEFEYSWGGIYAKFWQWIFEFLEICQCFILNFLN